MTSFMKRSAKRWMLIKAGRQIKEEIEKAGIDNLNVLADAGISIIATYFNGCSTQEKAAYKRDLNALLQMGVTVDMILTEVARQMPEIAPIIENRQDYKKTEIRNLELFLKES